MTSRSFSDFAVLYRLNAQSHWLIEAFDRSGIPYQTVGQIPLAEYKDIKAILAALWFVYNPAASFPLEQITTKKQLRILKDFLKELKDTASVSSLIEQIHHFMADEAILRLEEKGRERLQQLTRRAIPFDNRLKDFLQAVVLQNETDAYDPRADRVTLMTLHAAKGLEFPVVFIVGCEENLLPYHRENKPFDVEEERRLFYVGMTRAQQKLILAHAKSRFLFGQQQSNEQSRFVNDIENVLLEIKKAFPRKSAKEKEETTQLKLF